jgi:predicted kinase
MRKWMNDRLKRRKKAAESGKAEAAPTPLQPAYFDAEPSSGSPTPEARKPEAKEAEIHHVEVAEPQPVEAALEHARALPDPRRIQPAQPRPGGNLRRGRRRGRGGRGRGRRGGQASASRTGTQPLSSSTDSPAASSGTEIAAPPPASAAPSSGTPSKGVVVLAIGLPGSGKSSWFKRHNITPLSSDMVRALLFDDPTEQRFQDLVFSNLRSMLKARLIARRPLNYVDATNLTPHERQSWIKLAQDYGYEVQAVFFDVPVEVCLERNQRRERNVPDDVMRRMAAKLRPPTFEEGFAKVTVVRVKQKS